MFIRGSVVIAVVDAIANIILCNAASIVTGELCVGVTRSEETAHLITVISTVIIVVTAVVVGHTTAIATSKHCWLAGVEGCQSKSSTGQSSGQTEIKREGGDTHMLWQLILPDKSIKDDSNCGTACGTACNKHIDSVVSGDLF